MTPNEHRFLVKFAFDNMVDGFNDKSLLMWPAFDTVEHCEVWIIGRKVNEDKVMPLAKLLEDSKAAVKRYAPRKGMTEDYDYSQVEQTIIRP